MVAAGVEAEIESAVGVNVVVVVVRLIFGRAGLTSAEGILKKRSKKEDMGCVEIGK